MFAIAKKEIFVEEIEKEKWEKVKAEFLVAGLSVNVIKGEAPTEIGGTQKVYTAVVYCGNVVILNVPVNRSLEVILDALLKVPENYDIYTGQENGI